MPLKNSTNVSTTALSDVDTKGAASTPAAQPNSTPIVRSWRVLVVLSMLMAFASISTDLYLPALPTMVNALGARAETLDYTISGYLVGFSLGQLLWGPLGDRHGRKPPIAIGLILFIAGSAGCAISTSAEMMIAWRVIQAVGACASVVLARAMVRDLYVGPRAAQMMSSLMTVMAVAPLLGPSAGSMILHVGSWRAIFWTLVGLGIITLASLRLLPETQPPSRSNLQPLSGTFNSYFTLLKHPELLGYAGTSGFFYGGVYAYIAGTPFAYISFHHVSPEAYGIIFASGIVGMMAMNQLNSQLVHRFGSDCLMGWGASVVGLSGIALLATSLTGLGGLLGLVIPLGIYISATGLIVANSIAGALSILPSRAGAVSALIGAIQYGTGMIGSALVGAFANGTPGPMGVVISSMALGSALSALILARLQRAAR